MDLINKKYTICKKLLRNNCHLGNGCSHSHNIKKSLCLDIAILCVHIVTHYNNEVTNSYLYTKDFINLYENESCCGNALYDNHNIEMLDWRLMGGTFNNVINLENLYIDNIKKFQLINHLPLLFELCNIIRSHKFIFKVEPIIIKFRFPMDNR